MWERAGFADDARHPYASRSLALRESLPVIGRLPGHTRVVTTARCEQGGAHGSPGAGIR